jgi:hypothetical protein
MGAWEARSNAGNWALGLRRRLMCNRPMRNGAATTLSVLRTSAEQVADAVTLKLRQCRRRVTLAFSCPGVSFHRGYLTSLRNLLGY